jgi:hypothetical protein
MPRHLHVSSTMPHAGNDLPLRELDRLKVERNGHDLHIFITAMLLKFRDQVDVVVLLEGIDNHLTVTESGVMAGRRGKPTSSGFLKKDAGQR